MYNGLDVSLNLKLIFCDVNGNDKMWNFRLREFVEKNVVFLPEKGEPGLWCFLHKRGCVFVCAAGNLFPV